MDIVDLSSINAVHHSRSFPHASWRARKDKRYAVKVSKQAVCPLGVEWASYAGRSKARDVCSRTAVNAVDEQRGKAVRVARES